jgi:uncharacterized protein
MILVLSPSKTLDFESPLPTADYTLPDMMLESQLLIEELKSLTVEKLIQLMDISGKLAVLNAQRYKQFHTPFTPANARPALIAFKGDVYEGMSVSEYSKEDFAYTQAHVRILSGLYGLLKPLDLIQPYRLEMGTKLKTPRGKDLYAFWGTRITHALNQALDQQKNPVLINLASQEYFKAVKPASLKGPVITITFKEKHGRMFKVVGLLAKRARGLMADYIIKNRIGDVAGLKKFKTDGYRFTASLSSETELVFVR